MPEHKRVTRRKPATKPKSRRAAKPRPPRPPTVEERRTGRPEGRRTYMTAIGRRKSAVAQVRYVERGSGLFLINGVDARTYFTTYELQKIALDPLVLTTVEHPGDLSVKVHGGGKHGQAEAVRLGLSRLITKLQPSLRTTLKRAGFLSRDPRVKERKKYGLKRARRAPQWQKR